LRYILHFPFCGRAFEKKNGKSASPLAISIVKGGDFKKAGVYQ
jgi:hypothetical protein